MAKDPAINWYFDNWSGGTKGFTRHQKGCYMDLLEAQFYLGHLSLDQVKNILGADFNQWNTLKVKFSKDEQDNLFNERMELEKNKRQRYSESRSNNRKPKDMNNISNSYEKHMKNIPETETDIGIKKQNEEVFLQNFISENIRNEWTRLCQEDLHKRMLSDLVADYFSTWLSRIGIEAKREVCVGEHCRIDIGVYDNGNLICIIEAKNYREKNEYYKPLKQVVKYSQFGLPILFIPSIRQCMEVMISLLRFIHTGIFDNSFVFIPEDNAEKLFFNLTDAELKNTIEYEDRVAQKRFSPEEITSFWEGFKLQYSTDFYLSRVKVIQHFRDWLKKQPNTKTGSEKTNGTAIVDEIYAARQRKNQQ